MEDLQRELLARTPLATSVLYLWKWLAEKTWLEDFFERHRRPCYERIVSFSL